MSRTSGRRFSTQRVEDESDQGDPFRRFERRQQFDYATFVIGAALFLLSIGLVWGFCALVSSIEMK